MSLRTYEALYIVTPEAEDDVVQTVAKAVEKIVTDNGGATVRLDIWGRRRLAYKVKKHAEGCYILFRFDAGPSVIPKLETYFRLSEHVIRYLVTHFDEQMLRLEAEQQLRKEEEIRAGVAGRGVWGDRGRDDEEDEDEEGPRRRGRRGGRPERRAAVAATDDDEDDENGRDDED
ncbi:MAG TPA: 30S ribosomal protein S6 [Candidatus Hydrogenedentes bacterium]|nr:30S ribosomal protein S6 [Candidatus Hydrogenedentota bacterium]HNT87615.1 30S ribosomal protein S6 [Candidatus Hydrogenedentota bacterium]